MVHMFHYRWKTFIRWSNGWFITKICANSSVHLTGKACFSDLCFPFSLRTQSLWITASRAPCLRCTVPSVPPPPPCCGSSSAWWRGSTVETASAASSTSCFLPRGSCRSSKRRAAWVLHWTRSNWGIWECLLGFILASILGHNVVRDLLQVWWNQVSS